MRRVYVNDWIPAVRVAEDRGTVNTGPSMRAGVGAVQLSAAARARLAPVKGAKAPVGPMVKPRVVNGPLAQRAEPTKRNMRASSFAQAQGVRGSSSKGLWDQTFKMQIQAVIDGVTLAQKQLDDITSTMIGVDQQIADLQNAAGSSAPIEVQNAIDALSQTRQTFTQTLQPLTDTIDQMIAASAGAASLGFAPQIGSAPVQALNAVWRQVMAGSGSSGAGAGGPASKLGAMIAGIQKAGNSLSNSVSATTRTVNNYVNKINAEAAAAVAQQGQDALTANLAQQLTTGQIQTDATTANANRNVAIQAAQQQVTNAITNAAMVQNAGYPEAALAMLQDPSLAQAAATAGAMNALSVAIGQANSAVQAKQLAAAQAAQAVQVQQGAYVPPNYGPVQYPPPQPPYAGGAQYAPQYYPPAPQQPQYYAPQADLVPVAQPQYDPTQYYQTPQSGGGMEDGPGAAGPEWTNYVEGLRGVGFDPVSQPMGPPLTPVAQPSSNVSSAAVAQAQARAILGAAQAKVADARKQIELSRQADLAARSRAADPNAQSWWTPARKTLGALVGGLAGLGVAYEWGKRAK